MVTRVASRRKHVTCPWTLQLWMIIERSWVNLSQSTLLQSDEKLLTGFSFHSSLFYHIRSFSTNILHTDTSKYNYSHDVCILHRIIYATVNSLDVLKYNMLKDFLDGIRCKCFMLWSMVFWNYGASRTKKSNNVLMQGEDYYWHSRNRPTHCFPSQTDNYHIPVSQIFLLKKLNCISNIHFELPLETHIVQNN